jgi:proline dehydrogenase
MAQFLGGVLRSAVLRTGIGRAYVAGETAADARRVADRWRAMSLPAVFGYWGMDSDTPESVLGQYLECVALTAAGDYVSIKAHAIDYSTELYARLAAAAAAHGTHLHVDAEAPDTVDRAMTFADRVLPGSPVALGWTLPGRWTRSIKDAGWAGERGLRVRIVKGHYPDPADDQEMRLGYRRVAEALGKYRGTVAVAGHDLPLSERVGASLTEAGAKVEMELLYGLPWRGQLELARRHGWPLRMYVGYGRDLLPYALRQVRRKPQVLWWIARDILRARR